MAACKIHPACQREFRLKLSDRDRALNRAFQLDRNSPKADIPGRYPYRWEVRKTNLIVHHFSDEEQHWFMFSEDEAIPGIGVHVIVFKLNGKQLVFSIDVRKHEQAETVFKLELLGTPGGYKVVMDDLEQDRELLRQEIDEAVVPESWKRQLPPPPPPGYN